ncbi:MAG: efflux RND transporter periplasmic adaptor subunit [Spongiibacteraceae bacterium]
MKSILLKFFTPIITILALLLIIAWMAGVFTDKMSPGLAPLTASNHAGGIAVIKREQPIFESVPASIEAKQATLISSRILSQIKKVHVRAGDMVEQGQPLIDLEKTDLQSRVSQAEARAQSVTARLTEAKQSLTRATELTKKRLLAQADLDQAQANYDSLIADLSNAKQALIEANTALSFARVTAPINGRVIDRFAEPGDIAQPGVPLLSLYNPQSLRVEANVREKLALSLEVGQSLQVTIPALETSIPSVIEEIVPAGNAGSRSFLVKTRLEQSQGLLPGVYANLHIPAGIQPLLLIPAARVAQIGQLDIVWVAHQDYVERRMIRTGKTYQNGMIEVISGLIENEHIIEISN